MRKTLFYVWTNVFNNKLSQIDEFLSDKFLRKKNECVDKMYLKTLSKIETMDYFQNFHIFSRYIKL